MHPSNTSVQSNGRERMKNVPEAMSAEGKSKETNGVAVSTTTLSVFFNRLCSAQVKAYADTSVSSTAITIFRSVAILQLWCQ